MKQYQDKNDYKWQQSPYKECTNEYLSPLT